MQLKDFLTWSRWKTEKEKLREFISTEFGKLNWQEAWHELSYEIILLRKELEELKSKKEEKQ